MVRLAAPSIRSEMVALPGWASVAEVTTMEEEQPDHPHRKENPMFHLPHIRTRNGARPAPDPRAGRSRWAAVGAAVAVSIGAGSIGVVGATVDSGERPVLVQITPCRLLDTRDDIGNRDTPIGTGEVHTVDVHGINGECNIPAEASGVSLNVTATQATEVTNVRIFPDANNVPNASNLNASPFGSFALPNAVTTALDAAGAFSVFNEFGTVQIVIDVNGYYEDHNHDDRYVQQAVFDAHDHDDDYVQQNNLLWAVVDGDGVLERSSAGVTSAQLLDAAIPAGDYAVVFDRDISNCAYQATVGRPGTNVNPQIGFAQVANWIDDPDNGVIVFTKDQNGAGVENRGFHLLVTC